MIGEVSLTNLWRQDAGLSYIVAYVGTSFRFMFQTQNCKCHPLLHVVRGRPQYLYIVIQIGKLYNNFKKFSY